MIALIVNTLTLVAVIIIAGTITGSIKLYKIKKDNK